MRRESEESYTKIKAKYKDIPEEVLMSADENTVITKTEQGYLIENVDKSDLGIKKHSEYNPPNTPIPNSGEAQPSRFSIIWMGIAIIA